MSDETDDHLGSPAAGIDVRDLMPALAFANDALSERTIEVSALPPVQEPAPETIADLRSDTALVARYLAGDKEAAARFEAAIRRAADGVDAGAVEPGKDVASQELTADPEAFTSQKRDLSAAIHELEPAASPSEFRLNAPEGVELGLIKNVAQTLFASGVAPEIGNGLWGRAVELHKGGVDQLDTTAFNLRSQTTYAQLERQHGREGTERLYNLDVSLN